VTAGEERILDSINAILKSYYGAAPSDLSITISNNKASAAGRIFYIAASGEHQYFVKVGGQYIADSDHLIGLLADLNPPCYRSPRLYGRHNDVELWEYVKGDTLSFHNYSKSELVALVRSIAAVETQVSAPGLPQSYWLSPLAYQLRQAAKEIPEFSPFVSQFKILSAWEPRLFERSRGHCLTHNDFHSQNVICSPQGYYVVDWESASLGAPGASLRTFAEWPEAKYLPIVNAYAKFRLEFGQPVEVSEVLFAMRVCQAYWAFSTGRRQRLPDRFKRGFKLLQTITD
jgi:phosphotransferase family enzyme